MPKLFKTVYIFLFVFLVLQPHIIDHVSFVPKAYVESIVTLVIMGLAYGTYHLHRRELTKRELKTRKLEVALGLSEQKLIDAFQYIGFVNRRLPLLKNLSSDLLAKEKLNRRDKKTVIHRLLAVATGSIAKAEWGLLRFVEVASQRTMREFFYRAENIALAIPKISNKELIQEATPASQRTVYVIPTSDHEAQVQGFLVIPEPTEDIRNEHSILQAIVDQAQLFYRYLFI